MRFARLFLLAALIRLFLPNAAFGAKADPVLSAAEIDYPPFSTVDPAGRAEGFSVELLRAALASMNREVEFRVGYWSEVMDWLVRGEVQALPLVGRTPEREPLFDFTFPYMSLHGAIVVRDDEMDIGTLDDLRGRAVAVMRGDNAEEFLRREELGVDLRARDSFEDALRELSEGRHDAVVVQRLVALRLISELGLTRLRVVERPIEGFRQDFCFAVRKGDADTLALLNEGLALVIADGTSRRLHARWFAQLELPTRRRIVVGGDHAFPPYEYLDDDGRPAGFNVDLTMAIARAMGIDVVVRLGPWAEVVRGLETGEIDILQGMFYTKERGRIFDFAPPHEVSHYVGVVREGSGSAPIKMEDLAGLRVAVQERDASHDIVVASGVDVNFILVESQEGVLRALEEERADCGLALRRTLLQLIREREGISIGREPLASLEYSYAVRRGSGALLATFSEGLDVLRETGELQRLRRQWLGVHDYDQFRLRTVVRKFLMVLIPLLLALLAVSFWSMTLRRLVARRTEELRERDRKRQKDAERIARLNLVLRAIRDVNQLIVRENDAQKLISEGCRLLVEHRGYTSAVLVLTDDDGKSVDWARAGIASEIEELHAMLERDDLPVCCLHAFNSQDVVVVMDRGRMCGGCPIAPHCPGSQSLVVRLMHEGMTFGFLLVALDPERGAGEEERELFAELAGDLAYALHAIRTETERKASEKERKALSSQLEQTQRLEAVGRLAGGVAHDFNNLLMGILGNAEMCRDVIDPEHPGREFLDEIIADVQRSADLTRQLLAFARKQTIAPQVLDLNDAISDMLKLLQRLLGEDIDLVWAPGEDVWPINIDPAQINQVLTNLCVNARDAMEGGGKLTIETCNVVVGLQDDVATHLEAAPGDYSLLAVTDDGDGMSSEVLAHLFEPFFSTKPQGKGTGLGLATIYGIVKQNQGFINIYSEIGEGTTFKIYLPRATGRASSPPVAMEAAPADSGGSETLLLVEDDKAIRSMMERFLGRLGYDLIVADCPQAALRLAEKHKGAIHMLLTDVVMPGMSGRDLSERLLQLRPGVKCLFMSGYTANVIVHHGVLDKDVNFIQKPLSMQALAARVRALLDRRG